MDDNKKYDKAWLSDREEYFDGLKEEINKLKQKGVFE